MMAPLQPESLRFPRGVRFATRDEMPSAAPSAWLERAEREPPVVTTGYRLLPHGDQWYLEANVHADRVFDVVGALSMAILPGVAAPIVGIRGEEPVLGPYTSRDAAVRVFAPHVEALQHDGFLEFGIIFQNAGTTEEIFVCSAKYLRIWTAKLVAAQRALEESGIPEVENLAFIDEYPTVYEALENPDGDLGWSSALKDLEAAFAELPSTPTT